MARPAAVPLSPSSPVPGCRGHVRVEANPSTAFGEGFLVSIEGRPGVGLFEIEQGVVRGEANRLSFVGDRFLYPL